jgi:hypothetical protein
MIHATSFCCLTHTDEEQLVRPATELELVDIILSHQHIFGELQAVGIEIPSHGTSRLDVVLLSNDRVIGIEAKLSNWSKAIAQASCNRYCVDETYIAIWEGSYIDRACVTARRYGIGVVSIGASGVEIALPAEIQSPDPILRERIISRTSTISK